MNLFMQCHTVRPEAFAAFPPGYEARRCRPEDVPVWTRLAAGEAYEQELVRYFERVYAPQAKAFFERFYLEVNSAGEAVGTCGLWRAYGQVETVHWYRVLPQMEGLGLGRALLSVVMRSVGDTPVYLHTHPECDRAVHLYSEFGFELITDERIGYRENHVEAGMAYLQAHMPPAYFEKLRLTQADEALRLAALSKKKEEF